MLIILIAYPREPEELNAICRSDVVSKLIGKTRMTTQQHLQQATKSLMTVHCPESLLLILVHTLNKIIIFLWEFCSPIRALLLPFETTVVHVPSSDLTVACSAWRKTCRLKIWNIGHHNIYWSWQSVVIEGAVFQHHVRNAYAKRHTYVRYVYVAYERCVRYVTLETRHKTGKRDFSPTAREAEY